MTEHDPRPASLDGNALAGPLSTVFAAEITTATAVCGGCGHAGEVATLAVFGAPMGLVARCPACEHVMLRFVDLPVGRTLEMTGMAALRFPALSSR